MGKTLVDVNMRESSDEDEEVQHVNPVIQSENCGRREGHQGKSRELRGWQKWQCGPRASARCNQKWSRLDGIASKAGGHVWRRHGKTHEKQQKEVPTGSAERSGPSRDPRG
ncbi:hypothetical protein Y032_0033g2709 [Ancylostoma ceylanicum]|uniref:Uncharacterized protein n=1 Tax=Ancylostoma ceylanicum TaxID=53326 RepID=A0A016UQ14_9BILA|nr:hypothetical protein Y032_0033g2709 [Ancylostoma ceylanicum]